jgi:acyl carrier protein
MSTELKVREIISEVLDVEVEDVTYDTYLSDDLGADPYDLETILASLNDEFDTEISEDEIDSWETVSDVIAAVVEAME